MGKSDHSKRNEEIGTSVGDIFKQIGVQFNQSDEQQEQEREKVHYAPIDKGPHSPYNFIRINKEILKAPENGKYSKISDESYTGEIKYKIKTQTPIFIDNGRKEFYHNKDGKYAIPGSTLRGLIRSNVQILGLSSVRSDIDDYNLMYRDVASNSGLCKQYNLILGQDQDKNKHTVLKNVRAGYIACKDGHYYLYKNIKDTDGSSKNNELDYYVVSERYVLEEAEWGKFDCLADKFQHDLSYMYQNGIIFEKKTDENGKVHYYGEENKSYIPYYDSIKYEIENNKVCAIYNADYERGEPGYVISTGQMNEKKVFYVIPERDCNDNGEEIPKESISAYRIDYNHRIKAMPKKDKNEKYIYDKLEEFYGLPKEGEPPRPVFYIKYEGKLYFGYTPHLRLIYEHTILDGLQQNETATDFAKNMFGFSNEKDSRKSKVFFTDAVLHGEAEKEEAKKLILGEPKPTSYFEYLKQEEGKGVITYNNEDMELRGVKQYWLHKKVNDERPSGNGKKSNNENVKTTMQPLKENSCFDGSVRFQNLSKEELGLLIWSIELEKGCMMNVGMAKSYGYGKIKIDEDETELYLLNPNTSYTASSGAFQNAPLENRTDDKKEFVDDYKNYILKNYTISSGTSYENVMEIPPIQDFFAMKSCELDGKMVEYMSINHKDFTKFKQASNPLPTVKDVYGEVIKSNSGGIK